MKDGRKQLSPEDRILWGRVARSAVPLPGRSFEEMIEEVAPLDTVPERPARPAISPPTPAPPPRRTQAHQGRIDSKTRVRLAKGRLPIEGKIDLHGLTQVDAHGLLLSFLHRAYGDGRRFVLVVTGKGSSHGSEGVLRRAVPAWLATPPFRALVHSHEDAARQHGGSGAIYIRLRRRDADLP